MNIGKFDVMVLVVMSLAVVSISFVFPALGLSDTETATSDIPEMNVTENRFDFAGEIPEFPNTATSGTLWFNTTIPAGFSENAIWLEGGTEGGYELTLIQNASNGEAEVIISEWNGSLVGQDEVTLTENNTRAILSQGEYRVAVEIGEDNNPPDYLQVEWDIVQQTEAGGSFVGRLPLVGSIFGVASDVAAVLAWAVTIFIWFSQTIVQGSLNIIGALYDASSYFISLFAWLISTYGTVITSAPGWTSIFVALPGIILSAVLGKFVIIFISLIPTT